MRRTGVLGNYLWVEDDDLSLEDVLKEITSIIANTYAVNTSFDSGVLGSKKFKLDEKDIENGWKSINNRAVSPRITERNISTFLYTDGYDEWYFFNEVPEYFDAIAFCNYYGLSVGQADQLNFEGACDMVAALENYAPIAVAGWNNEFSYYLTRKLKNA